MKHFFASLLALLFAGQAFAQENLTYQKPPKEIMELVDVERAPQIRIDDKHEFMILLYTDAYKSIEELSEKEMRLGGLRINPVTNISSRERYNNNIKIKKLAEKVEKQVSGLPKNPRISNVNWSPDQKYVSFTQTTDKGVELWLLTIATASAKKLTDGYLNCNMAYPTNWFAESNAMLVPFLPKDKAEIINTESAIPTGPTVTESAGEKAQNRTYQDLLKNPTDEANFEQLVRSDLYRVELDGTKKEWAKTGMYSNINFSPDGKYVLISLIKKPFSYIVTYSDFPTDLIIYGSNGNEIKTFNERPLMEALPKGFMACETGKRGIRWRGDEGATLVWAEAQDGGDPEKEVDFRDNVYQQRAPFTEEPHLLIQVEQRFSGISWATPDLAFANDYWWNTRNTKMYLFNPSDASQAPKKIEDRNYQDKYSDPGRMVNLKNEFGNYVVDVKNNKVSLIGDGYTKEGQFPFIEEMDLSDLKKTRKYTSKYTDKLERILQEYDAKKGQYLVRLESSTMYPNYYVRTLGKKDNLQQVTYFQNPFKSIENVHKEVIKYKRADGLDLSATLYLPVGYDMTKKEKMPMVMWAYPAEYKDKSSAGQVTSNPNEFTYPYYGSMVYWVTRGYVVLDDAAFPIVGEGTTEPNDNFVEQLVSNAKAAIDAVDKLGYIDRTKVAVGGHSYGAFMTANLLTHCDLFAAGIARSGAYNRTLTPFGFQSEERSYWDAPEVYNTMSPFMNANKMKHPLLLIHGEADNNSGTYPMQSERYFNALKGLGGVSRLVILPKESHGYSAKESILHMLWEQDQWLEKYLK
jgi:dipeptidyl aminopeptidase/acylaminoacyl peptidase